jgi:iron(III) transport system substrate-binding protein
MLIHRNLTGAAVGFAFSTASALAGEVNVYSYREPVLIEPMLNAFSEQSGHKVNVVFADKGLIERAKEEGRLSPMDVLLTVDIGNIVYAKDAGITAPVDDTEINEAIPAKYRDPDGHWIGLTSRIRVIYAAKDRVKDQKSLTYEDLATDRFDERVCTRSGKHVYQIALLASMINYHGEQEAEEWLTGLKDNLARKPSGGDRDQVKAIWQGECDVALGNHYYYVKMMQDDEQREWAESVNVVFPNQQDRGVHANISAMSLGAYAPNKEVALELMRFLTSLEAQELYAEINGEYPLRQSDEIKLSPVLDSLGTFKIEDLPLQAIADKRDEALLMTDRVGYDH